MPQCYRDELLPQPPPIAPVEWAETFDGANSNALLNVDNTQIPIPTPTLPVFTTNSNSYSVYQVYPHG